MVSEEQSETPQPGPLIRKISLVEVDQPHEKAIGISDDERREIADLLALQGLDNVDFSYRLRSAAGKRVKLVGRLCADVIQTCVVSLEPVPARIDVPVEAEFWPPEKIDALAEQQTDPSQNGEADWPEPIDGDTIDLGPLVYETLATALDPYPKKPGAEFDWTDPRHSSEEPRNGPFAALKSLKKP